MKKYMIKRYTDELFDDRESAKQWLLNHLYEEFDFELEMTHGNYTINGTEYTAAHLLKSADIAKYEDDYCSYVTEISFYEISEYNE